MRHCKTSFGHGKPVSLDGLIENGRTTHPTFTKHLKIWERCEGNQPTLALQSTETTTAFFRFATGRVGTCKDEKRNSPNAEEFITFFSVAILRNNRPETLRLFRKIRRGTPHG